MKKFCIVLSIVCIGLGAYSYHLTQENYRLNFLNDVGVREYRILKDEIHELERKPSYEQGVNDTLIKMGSPSQPGAYQDGFQAAANLFADDGWKNGYHAAIAQFGYQQTHSKYLVPEPKNNTTAKSKKVGE